MNYWTWIFVGIYFVIGIFIAECFIGSLEAARHTTNSETPELSKPTRWVFRGIIVALSVGQLFTPYMARIIMLAMFVIFGFIWSMQKPLRGNAGGKAAATAMLSICFPASVSIIWDVILELIHSGWNIRWRQVAWVIGPIVALVALLIAGEIEEEPDELELKRKGNIWIVIAIIMIIITAIVGYFMQKGGMFA